MNDVKSYDDLSLCGALENSVDSEHMIIAFDRRNHQKAVDDMMAKMNGVIEFGSWKTVMDETCTLTGRRCTQHKDFSIEIDMNEYIESTTDHRLSRESGKQESEALTPAEHRSLRALSQRTCRMLGFEHAFSASELAGAMAKPTVADTKEANKGVRRSRNNVNRAKLIYKSDVDLYANGAAVVVSHDASFDNMPKLKS